MDFTKAILHPGVKVFAGVWTSDVYSLSRAGWKFDVSLAVDYGRTIQVMLRNPLSGMVGGFVVNRSHFEMARGAEVLYFREDILIEKEHAFFRTMRIAPVDLLQADVGVAINTQETEFREYTPEEERGPQEIIVTPEKVPELLERIRAAQEPRARELLRKQEHRDRMSVLFPAAKILTIK